MERPQNWVFLGDSLTEGVGSSRVSYVSQLAELLRDAERRKPESDRRPIHEFRLRRVDPASFNRFISVNHAGVWNADKTGPAGAIWLWNLGCEGTTVINDLEWLPLLDNLRPERIFIQRGAVESLVRPEALIGASWPWWVPPTWRSYAAMDPRCYFSTISWRRTKQRVVDGLKQRVRLTLLSRGRPSPLMAVSEIEMRLTELLAGISPFSGKITLVGLTPVGSETFPGSPVQFREVDRMLAAVAKECGAQFVDLQGCPDHRFDHPALYYRDRFHPNIVGAREIALYVASATGASRG